MGRWRFPKERYDEEEKMYREQLEKYSTKEEKLEYLEGCHWNIEMIDHWQDRDWICSEVVEDLIKELEGETNE